MDDGVQSTKVYMTYGYKIDDDGILEVLKKMKELHGITAFRRSIMQRADRILQKQRL